MKVPRPCDTPSWICASMGCQERPCSFRECNSSPKRKIPLPGSLSITRVPQETWTQATPKTARGQHDHPFSRKQPLCEAVGHFHPGMFCDLFWDRGSLCPPSLALACDPQPSGCWAYIPDWHMFFSPKCLPPQPLVCTGTLCARSVGRLDVKGGAGPAGLWSRHQHQIQNRHLHSFLPCWEISEPKPAFLPRGVILKPVSFSE